MSIIAIAGKIGSGKNTVGDIIQKICLTNEGPTFEQKSFAGKLKQIASLLTGIPVEKFEDQEFKKTLLGPEWGTVSTNPLNAIPVFGDVRFLHLMSVRELLQKLGTEAMRDGLHKNVWVNALFSDVSLEDNIIITDMRFENEMEAVKERGGITIRVVRPVEKSKTTARLHPSETSLDSAEFDYEIINDGEIVDLIEKVKEILIKSGII
jgi:dephospho-CoA kinase